MFLLCIYKYLWFPYKYIFSNAICAMPMQICRIKKSLLHDFLFLNLYLTNSMQSCSIISIHEINNLLYIFLNVLIINRSQWIGKCFFFWWRIKIVLFSYNYCKWTHLLFIFRILVYHYFCLIITYLNTYYAVRWRHS